MLGNPTFYKIAINQYLESTRINPLCINEDYKDILPLIPFHSIDTILTDPPYGIASKDKMYKKRLNDIEEFNLEWDKEVPLGWIPEAKRILNSFGGTVICFTDKADPAFVWKELEKNGIGLKNTMYWIKVNPPPRPRKNMRSSVETAVYCKKGKGEYWDGGAVTRNIFYEAPIVGGKVRFHPTQKPVKLLEHWIKLTTKKNGVVLDCFSGSGSTGIAAYRAGRKSILIEKNKEYFDKSMEWIENEIHG